MDRRFAEAFAHDWIRAWNSHDLAQILSHYADDFEMSSPLIALYANEPTGRLRGKERIGAYWQEALDRNADLHFELISVFVGATSLVIHYRNQAGRIGAEAFFFDSNGKVQQSAAHYLSLE